MDFEAKRKLAVQRLAEEIVNGRLVVFMGAGCSAEAGLPSWGSLISKLKDKFDLFCKYGINPYLQPLNQSTNQPINDICRILHGPFILNPSKL